MTAWIAWLVIVGAVAAAVASLAWLNEYIGFFVCLIALAVVGPSVLYLVGAVS